VLPGLEDPLDAFEEELGRVSPRANANARWIRRRTSAAESTANLELMFGDNALQGLLDQFASHHQSAQEPRTPT
jgi:hypothetical protein